MALASFRLALLRLAGLLPKTHSLEARDKALRDEYQGLLRFGQSDEMRRFLELKDWLASGEPERIRHELANTRWADSEEHAKENAYLALQGNEAIRNYNRVKGSQALATYQAVEESGKPFRLKELARVVEAPEYQAERKRHKQENTEEYQMELEYTQLHRDKELNEYFKLKQWKPLLDYLDMLGSPTLERYEELRRFVASDEFHQRKLYLKSSDKFKRSEAYRKIQEYKALAKSSRIRRYEKALGHKKFDEIKRWELTFADDFNGPALDTSKWIPRYFWGEALLKKSYSLAADKHWYPDANNLRIENSLLRITTRREKAQGIAWDLRHGFIPKEFHFTSGIINTGHAFRQLYGRFEAKIRLSGAPGVYHAFWLVGDTMLPEVDIMRQQGKDTNAFRGAYFWQNGESAAKKSETQIKGINLGQQFYILSIDWLPGRMVWKINGIPFKTQTENLPQGAVYPVLSSGVTHEEAGTQQATLEVDWVRCWKTTV